MAFVDPDDSGFVDPDEMEGSRVSVPQDVRGGESSFGAFEGLANAPVDSDLTKRQANIDYFTGVRDASIRADLSRMDTDEERAMMLDKRIGKGEWRQDKYGQYIISTKAMDKLGLEHKGMPVALDAHRVTPYDFADWRGDAPTALGATALGIATGGMGAIPAIATTVLGATGLQAIDEAADALRGENLQSGTEVGKDLAKTAGAVALGEGVFRGALRPLGRKLMAPEASKMTPEAIKALHDASEMGFRPKVGQISRPKIIGRIESLAEKIFGSPADRINQKAILKNVAKFKKASGPHTTAKHDIGELTSAGIKATKKEFMDRASVLYKEVDDAVVENYKALYGEAPNELAIIPTASLKAEAKALWGKVPKNTKGEPVFTGKETIDTLQDAMALGDKVTIKQMQMMRQKLSDLADPGNALPGISHRDMGKLVSASTKTFNDAAEDGALDPVASQALKVANRYYRMGIKKFDDNLISKIIRDPRKAGAIDPSDVVDTIFHRGSVSKINRVKKVIPKETWARIKHKTMDDILLSIEDKTTDPLQSVFNGKRFLDGLEKHGRPKLIAMYGEKMTDDLYKFGHAVNLVSSRTKFTSGGLVAAYIALHPFKNLGRITRLWALGNVLSTERGLKYMTIGLTAPKTRAGADAISRLSTMVAATVRDETNTPMFNLPVDEPKTEDPQISR